jgi:hypothetical protein
VASIDGVLQELAGNTVRVLCCHLQERMTIPQAKALCAAMKENTLIEQFSIELHYWPLQTNGLLVDCIRSSPKLNSLLVRYLPFSCEDSDET